jgi:hypothetical protein
LTVSSFPLPPADLVNHPTDTTGQAILDVLIAVGMLAVVAAAVHLGRRYRTWVPIAIVLGSTASALLEPLPDLVAGLWYYAPHQQTMYTAYGNSLPVWVFFSYPVYYAGFGLIFWRVIEGGATHRTLWLMCAPMAAYLAVTEVFLINTTHLYTYYGPGAFRVGHFPLFICLLNTVIVLSIGVFGTQIRRGLATGDQPLAAFFLPGVSLVVGLVMLPAALFTVAHTTDPSPGLVRAATLFTMASAVAVWRVCIRLVPAGGFTPMTVPQMTPSSANLAISVVDMPSSSPSTHSLSSP